MNHLRRVPRRGVARPKRFRSIPAFPRHCLENFVVSPKLGTCTALAELGEGLRGELLEVHGATDPTFGAQRRLLDSMTLLFHRVYDAGYIWYPRDRWRTAWSLTLRVAKRGFAVSPAIKFEFYRNVSYLRNPSSPQEAMK